MMIHHDGMTVVPVEQHPRLDLMLASYVYVLGSGEPVLQGKTSDLMLNEGVKKAHLGV